MKNCLRKKERKEKENKKQKDENKRGDNKIYIPFFFSK